jgi:glutathione S-transferase
MRLYYAPNTISIAVAITLHEAGLEYDPVCLNFRDGEQIKADYLAVNPKGRVPTLDVEGERLTETGAILEYIAAIAPQSDLAPADPIQAVHMRSVMYYLASTMHVNHAHRLRGARWADRPESHADMTAKVPETMRQSADYVSRHALRGDYVLSDAFSIADPYLFVVCNWLEGDGVPLADFPVIEGFMARMRGRTSVQAVIERGMLLS